MNEEAFIKAILDSPDDDAYRMIYADWLDEQGRGEQAEFIRLQCKLAEGCRSCDGTGRNVMSPCPCAARRARERELLVTYGANWLARSIGHNAYVRIASAAPSAMPFRRGFVGQLTCAWADCRDHLDAIRAAWPVRRVELTTMPEVRFRAAGFVSTDPRHVEFGLMGRDRWLGLVRWGERDGERPLALPALAAEWPGIDFVLPPGRVRYRTLEELVEGLRVVDPAFEDLPGEGLLRAQLDSLGLPLRSPANVPWRQVEPVAGDRPWMEVLCDCAGRYPAPLYRVMMERRPVARQDRRRTVVRHFYVGQCAGCGTVVWAEGPTYGTPALRDAYEAWAATRPSCR